MAEGYGGRKSRPGLGEKTVDDAGSILHASEPGLHQRGELVEAVLGEVGQGPFQVRPDAPDHAELRGVRRQLVGGQPPSGVGQLPHGAAGVRVQTPPPPVRRHPGHPEPPGHLPVTGPCLDQIGGRQPDPLTPNPLLSPPPCPLPRGGPMSLSHSCVRRPGEQSGPVDGPRTGPADGFGYWPSTQARMRSTSNGQRQSHRTAQVWQ